MHAVLAGRLPEGQVLSHDLLEGSIARCAAVTDITVIEDAPFHADVAASRVHRWTRGDWQLLPILLHPLRYRMRAINRWKMFDNLRRSLVAPMSLVLLLLALGGAVLSPWAALAVVLAAFTAGPLMGAIAGFAPSRDDLAKLHFYRQASVDLARALWGGLWHLAQLIQLSLMACDAIARTIWRMAVSHRHLLQWTTAATAQAQAQTTFAPLLWRHRMQPVVALALLAALLAADTPHPWWAFGLCLLWTASPVLTWWVSRVWPARAEAALPLRDQAYLQGIARDTWRLFERCVGAEDNHLPPDNLQTAPHDMVAHRTSPTNIGLYLLSVACARQFGWIGTQELLTRLEATLATLGTLQRHRGHLLNWYDTVSRTPLLPMYVSTVDSGNLSGHLLAVAQACLELAHAPHDDAATRRAIGLSMQRLKPMLARTPEWLQAGTPLARLLALPDPLAACRDNAAEFDRLLREAGDELAQRWPEPSGPAPTGPPAVHDQLHWFLADHLATLRSAGLDVRAAATASVRPARDASTQVDATPPRLVALARACQRIAWQPDFSFLYHRKRHLFHIGYRVAEQELDAGFYDLLASESRLTSLLAIAKGDVPVGHWGSLGRLFFAVGAKAGLRSWSGSMFEYLMPGLVLDEPHGSVLRDASRAALDEQWAFVREQGIPWGISESAYAGSDHTLAYQYAPQGVPRLALRRTPIDELVIAPYATALAAQIAPHRACQNFAALQALVPRAQYGFVEALDFSSGAAGRSRAVHAGVHLHGASPGHDHRGAGQCAARWRRAALGHGRPAHRGGDVVAARTRAARGVDAVRAARGATATGLATARARVAARGAARLDRAGAHARVVQRPLQRVAARQRRRRQPLGCAWHHALARRCAARCPWQFLLSALWDQQPRPVSITQHPGARPGRPLHAACSTPTASASTRLGPSVQAHTTVWVSPEDDIEFRQRRAAQPERAHARHRTDVGFRGDAGRRACR